jgi:hypothetical protein
MASSKSGSPLTKIFSHPLSDDSAGHIHSCRGLIKQIKQTRDFRYVIYAGMHLRLCIEHLWFENLTVALGNKINEAQYAKATKSATTLYKLIDEFSPHYSKYCEFGTLIRAAIRNNPLPPFTTWDIPRLKRAHGGLSTRLLHFHGFDRTEAERTARFDDDLSFVDKESSWIWKTCTTMGVFVIFQPESLKEPARQIWEDFRDGKIQADSVKTRLGFL